MCKVSSAYFRLSFLVFTPFGTRTTKVNKLVPIKIISDMLKEKL